MQRLSLQAVLREQSRLWNQQLPWTTSSTFALQGSADGQHRASINATNPSAYGQRSMVVNTNKKDIHLRVLPVLVKNGNRTGKTFALLDSGSGITTSLARRLGLSGKNGHCSQQWTNSKKTYIADSERVEFHLGKLDRTRQFRIAADRLEDLDLQDLPHFGRTRRTSLHCKRSCCTRGS